MPIGSLPPWLNVTPSDFLRATQAGAQLGTQIAENSQRAWEAQQRMRMESEAQNAKLQQFALEQAAHRLAADRLEQYRQAEIENRKSELGLQQQGLGLRGEGLDVQREGLDLREKGLNNAFANAQQRIKDEQERERDRQTQRETRNDMTREMLDLREKMAKESYDKPMYQRDENGKLFRVNKQTGELEPVKVTGQEEKPSESHFLKSIGDAYKGSLSLGSKLFGLSNFIPQTPPSPAGATNVAAPPPSPIPDQALPQPQNPYLAGRRYGKLTYKGGDPNLESSWEKAE